MFQHTYGRMVGLRYSAAPRAKQRVPRANQNKLVDVRGSIFSIVVADIA